MDAGLSRALLIVRLPATSLRKRQSQLINSFGLSGVLGKTTHLGTARVGSPWSAFVGSGGSVGLLRSISIALLCRCSSGVRAVAPPVPSSSPLVAAVRVTLARSRRLAALVERAGASATACLQVAKHGLQDHLRLGI